MPELEQKRSDAAHPTPRHPDEMNPVMLAGEELLQIDFRGERHDWFAYIFPSFQQRGRLRFSAPGARNSPTFDRVCPDPRRIPGYTGRAARPQDRTPSK